MNYNCNSINLNTILNTWKTTKSIHVVVAKGPFSLSYATIKTTPSRDYLLPEKGSKRIKTSALYYPLLSALLKAGWFPQFSEHCEWVCECMCERAWSNLPSNRSCPAVLNKRNFQDYGTVCPSFQFDPYIALYSLAGK